MFFYCVQMKKMQLTNFDLATIAKDLTDIQELTTLLSLSKLCVHEIIQCRKDWEISKDNMRFDDFATDTLEDFLPYLNHDLVIDGLNEMNKKNLVWRLYKYRCICCV